MSGRILVVDDDESTRLTLAALLEDDGFEVVTASGRSDLEDVLEREPPFALLLVDYHLDDTLGVDLIPLVHAHSSNIAVVMITGEDLHETPRGVSKLLKKGGNPQLTLDEVRSRFDAEPAP